MKRNSITVISLIILSISTLLLFQNCGNGFESQAALYKSSSTDLGNNINEDNLISENEKTYYSSVKTQIFDNVTDENFDLEFDLVNSTARIDFHYFNYQDCNGTFLLGSQSGQKVNQLIDNSLKKMGYHYVQPSASAVCENPPLRTMTLAAQVNYKNEYIISNQCNLSFYLSPELSQSDLDDIGLSFSLVQEIARDIGRKALDLCGK